MKRSLRPEEIKLWSMVAHTIRPAPGRKAPTAPSVSPAIPSLPAKLAPVAAPASVRTQPTTRPPQNIEPRRRQRLVRERDDIEARLDLHGMTQDQARAALHGFIQRAYDNGVRSVLVITGRGYTGDGVLRRYTPDWLADPAIRPLVAGVSQADRRHGGEGALYVALKRRPGPHI